MDTELLDTATRQLYAAAPDDFATTRHALARQTADNGDDDTAREIGKLRKPTNAARVINALAAEDADVAKRLSALGDLLRSAQNDLDAARMRELTEQRRSTVADCARRALALAGMATPSAALRDDVVATFDAAVADPDVAARLGALQRPERFSGFGFAGSSQPQLRLVRGGNARDDNATKATPDDGKQAELTAAERRKMLRARDKAQRDFDAADAALDTAARDERSAKDAVGARERDVADAKSALDAARSALEASRTTLKQAKDARREARLALDRGQRTQS